MVRSGCPTGGHLSLWGLEQAARETIEGSPFFEQPFETGTPDAMMAETSEALGTLESSGGTGAIGVVSGLEGSPTSTVTQLLDQADALLSPQTVRGPVDTTLPRCNDKISTDAGTGTTPEKNSQVSSLDYTLGTTHLPAGTTTHITRATNTGGDGVWRGYLVGSDAVNGLSEAADAECWARLHEQLRSLQQNVQNFANRRSPKQPNFSKQAIPTVSAPSSDVAFKMSARRVEGPMILVEDANLQSPSIPPPQIKAQATPARFGIQRGVNNNLATRCALSAHIASLSPRQNSSVPSLTSQVSALATSSPRQHETLQRGTPVVASLHPILSPRTPRTTPSTAQAPTVGQFAGNAIVPDAIGNAGCTRSASVVGVSGISTSARSASVRSSSANGFNQRVVAAIPRVAPPLYTTKLLRPASAAKLHQSEYAGVPAQVASTPTVPVPMGVTMQPRFVPVAGLGTSVQRSKLNSAVHSPRQPVQAASWIQATMSPRAQTPVGSNRPRMH